MTELSQGPASQTLGDTCDPLGHLGPSSDVEGANIAPRAPFSPGWLPRLIWVAGSRVVCLWEAGLGPGERTARSCGKVKIYSFKKERLKK